MGVTYIARISKPGFSVYDTDPKNFSLREDTNSPKAFIRGYFEIPPTSEDNYTVTKVVKHNLGYNPLVQTYIFDKNTGRMKPITATDFNLTVSTTQSVVTFFFSGMGGSAGKLIFYDIFYEGG